MYVIDLNEEQYPAQLTTTWEGDLNGNQNLSATIKPSKVNLQYIHDITEMWRIVDDDDTEYKIIYCKRRGSGNLLTVDIKALPKFQDDLNNQRVHRRIDEHLTANAFFNIVFHEEDELGNVSGYNFVLNGTFEAQRWEGLAEGSTRLEMLEKGLNRYKAEFRIVGNTFYIENRIGNDTSQRYEERLNASNIVQEIDANEFYTYAKGYGDYGDGEGGEDWRDAKLIREYTSPLAKIPAIGIREAPPIKNGNITTRATMDEQLKILVDESLKISVTADIHDLTRQGYPIAQSNLGDRVFLIDRRIGFEEEIRVVRKSVTRNWKREIIDLKLTFGAPGLTKRHQSSLNAAAKNITELLAGRIKLPYSVLDDAVKNATEALQAAQTELTFSNNGILAIDKKNPNLVTLLNSAGLGVSKDGGATFRNAITGNGIVADVIYAGTLNADQVAIRGGDGTSYMHISGAELEARGRFRRTWLGETDTHDVSLRFQNGYLRARNETKDWSLYFSDFGISTYADAEGDSDASGSLIFRDHTYSTARSVMLHSHYGVVALRSEENRVVVDAGASVSIDSAQSGIYLRPMRKSRVGNNEFSFRVKDNPSSSETDGWISYGSPDLDFASGIRFQKTTAGTPTIYATNGNGDIGTGDFHAREFRNASSILYKTNINPLSVKGLPVINNLEVVEYIYQSDVDNGNYYNWQVGFLSEVSPEVSDSERKSINLYKLSGYTVKALQEEYQARMALEKRIEDLELMMEVV